MKGLEELLLYVDAPQAFSPALRREFTGIWEYQEAARKHLLSRAGETENYLYFILSGVQRIYHLSEDGREATLIFTYAPSFGGVLDSMLLQKPSAYYYECLSASSYLRTPATALFEMAEKWPEIRHMVDGGIYGALHGLLQRMVELQTYSNEEKFRELMKRSPHLLRQVPHKYIANYLGIDATNFSKLYNSTLI